MKFGSFQYNKISLVSGSERFTHLKSYYSD